MIQPALPALPSALALPVEAGAMAIGTGAEGADFGALLAIQGLTASAAEQAAEPPTEALNTPEASPEATAMPGKILPPGLPFTDPTAATPSAVTARPDGEAAAAPPARAKPAKVPVAPYPLPLTENIETPTPGLAQSPLLQEAPDQPDDAGSAEPLPALAAIRTAAEPQSAPAQPPAAARASQSPQNLPPAVTAQPIASATKTDDPAPASPAPAAAQAFAAPSEEVRINLPLPQASAALSRGRDDTAAVLPDAEGSGADALPAFTASQSAPATIAPVSSAAIQPLRPHDFAALIERIAVAREAAAPQTVSVTLPHQDFGTVRLHFRPEEAGLSIAMTSADPDFARSAAAAPAPVLPIGQSEAQLSFQPRGEGASNSAGPSGGQPQSRGSNGERRENQPQANPTPRDAQNRSAPRQGIFA